MESGEALYTNLCSSLIRRDQYPDRACLSGSGFPIPSNGLRLISLMRLFIRRRKDASKNEINNFLNEIKLYEFTILKVHNLNAGGLNHNRVNGMIERDSMGVHEGKLRLRVLSEKDSRAIHQTALKILAGTGMRILDRDTVGILTDQGCRVTDDGYVLFDEETVARALASVPSRMVLYDRNGEIRIDTDDPVPRFGPGINCLNILDYQTGRHRLCRLSDVSKNARVCEQLSHIDWVQSLGSPGDISPEKEAIATVRAMVAQTGKPIGFTGHDETEAGRDMFCAALAGTTFIQGLGRLSAGKTGFLEMLILCDELAGAARRVAAGVSVNQDTLALDVVERGAKSGSYLQDDHTLNHVRTESWTPSLFGQTDLDTWRESDASEIRVRIHEKLRELLDE